MKPTTNHCQLTGKNLPIEKLASVHSIHPNILKLIQEKHPDWLPKGYIAVEELNKYRNQYIRQLLSDEQGRLNKLDEKVIESIRNTELLSKNVDVESDQQLTLGDKIADKVADFGGSWTFIIIFFSFLFIWMAVNIFVLYQKPFDPYPFILLNLILSCLAAIQAPIIMMSQNRQESKDRLRSQYDYQVNLKAELEIRLLHEKVDHLLMHQGQKLLELQQFQVEMLEQLMKKKSTN